MDEAIFRGREDLSASGRLKFGKMQLSIGLPKTLQSLRRETGFSGGSFKGVACISCFKTLSGRAFPLLWQKMKTKEFSLFTQAPKFIGGQQTVWTVPWWGNLDCVQCQKAVHCWALWHHWSSFTMCICYRQQTMQSPYGAKGLLAGRNRRDE